MASSDYGHPDSDILHGLNVITTNDLSQFLLPEEEEDLNVFRSHQFIDYDTGLSADFSFVPPKPESAVETTSTTSSTLDRSAPVDFDPALYTSKCWLWNSLTQVGDESFAPCIWMHPHALHSRHAIEPDGNFWQCSATASSQACRQNLRYIPIV